MRQANYGKEATQMTLDMINDNMKNNNPALHPQQRRIIDLFIVLYGSFRWVDVAAKTRVSYERILGYKSRFSTKCQCFQPYEMKILEMATIFANGLIWNTANWNFQRANGSSTLMSLLMFHIVSMIQEFPLIQTFIIMNPYLIDDMCSVLVSILEVSTL
jgi:hypothetical protein